MSASAAIALLLASRFVVVRHCSVYRCLIAADA